jgi:CheY-like chemotaxis protein
METQATILVVDDEEVILDSCRQILERSRHRVETAPGGYEAMRILRRGHCDLLILDLKMPGMDGRELLGRVRTEDRKSVV